jgi:hypothetical protein
MEAYWRSGFFDLGTRRGEWSASRPGRFTPRERAPVTHWIGGWVGPRAGLDAVVSTDENHEKHHSRDSLTWPRIEPCSSRDRR